MAKKKPVAKKKAKAAPKKKPAAAKKKAAPAPKAAKSKKRAAPPSAPAEHPQSAMPWRDPLPGETKVGVIDDYFGHLGVIAFKLDAPLAVGDKIHVRGHTTDLQLTVASMQVDHASVQSAEAGASVGVKVDGKCRGGDYVFRVSA